MPEEADKKEHKDWLNAKILQKTVVVDDEGNILILRRISTGPAARLDKWDLPGGSISSEDLETSTNTLIRALGREVKEETNLTVADTKFIYLEPWVFERSPGKILGIAIGYKCSTAGVKPGVVLGPEHYEYKWCSKDEALNFDFGDDGGLHKNILENV